VKKSKKKLKVDLPFQNILVFDCLSSHKEINHMQDPIRATADDAVTSKLAASALGYYEDRYAAPLAHTGPAPPKRMPIINRGTWAR
jgi:hypothetical protein